ncbi:MAG: hypothetical protein Q8930_05065 [Bacillota bacterium]|nr:hypothetical protein [Bacillota bacterium]
MNCNICQNEFNYIEGLKFCPYCGSKLNVQFIPSGIEAEGNTEASDSSEKEQQEETTVFPEKEETVEEKTVTTEPVTKKLHDTLEMPVITDEDLKKDKKMKRSMKRAGVLSSIGKAIISKKVLIPAATLAVLGLAAFLAINLLFTKPVDEAKIKEDMTGKTVILPKGSSIVVKNGVIREIAITGRTPDKNDSKLQYIDAKMTLNNNSIQVSGTFTLTYRKEGRNQWTLNDKIALKNDIAVKAVAGMEEAALIDELKKQKISIGGEELGLGDGIVKEIKLTKRTPDFNSGKEVVLADVAADSGIVTTSGSVTASLTFADENWKLDTVSRSSDQDFKLALSGALSDDSILAQIKKKPLQENVTYSTVFGGREYGVNDKFTKSFKVTDKSFDEGAKQLKVSVRRENAAGVINSTLTTAYTLNVSLKGMTLDSSGKSKVEAVTVTDISNDSIAAMLVGANMKMGSYFFWGDSTHKITADEAKTFKLDKALSKKDVQNARYVYGNITYMDGKKAKGTSIVVIFLVSGDGSGGYAWKLDSVISSESYEYQFYSPEAVQG